jgi:hypothetical protein
VAEDLGRNLIFHGGQSGVGRNAHYRGNDDGSPNQVGELKVEPNDSENRSGKEDDNGDRKGYPLRSRRNRGWPRFDPPNQQWSELSHDHRL